MKRYRLLAAVALLGFAQVAEAAPHKVVKVDYAAIVGDSHRSAGNRAMDENRLPAAILEFSGIRAGDTVADYQAGGGYFTEMLGDLVGPKGRVFALESARFYKAATWDPIRAAHPNVIVIASGNLALAPRSVDVLFAHLVFHDLFLPGTPTRAAGNPDAVIAGWFAAVRPGGHVIVADHVGPSGDVTAIAGSVHRISKDAAVAAMTKAGFVLEGESDVLHRSDDDHTKRSTDPAIRGKTDRFLLKFRRP